MTTTCANCHRLYEVEGIPGISFSDFVDQEIPLADAFADTFLCGDKGKLLDTRPGSSSAVVSQSPNYVDVKLCELCVNTLVTCFKARDLFLRCCHPEGFVKTVLNSNDESKILPDLRIESCFLVISDLAPPLPAIDEQCVDAHDDCKTESTECMDYLVPEPEAMESKSLVEALVPEIVITSPDVWMDKDLIMESQNEVKDCRILLNRLPDPFTDDLSESPFPSLERLSYPDTRLSCRTTETDTFGINAMKIADDGLYYCQLCALPFTHKAILIVHLQLDHLLSNANGSGVKLSANTCGICSEYHKTRNSLLHHTFFHTGEKRYVCSFRSCDYSTMKNDSISKHKVEAHDGQEEDYNDVSDNEPSTTETENAQHYQDQQYRPLDQQMDNETEPENITETETENPRFMCRFKGCSTSFDVQARLLAHVQLIHLPTRKGAPWKCRLCNKTLGDTHHTHQVEAHMFLHAREATTITDLGGLCTQFATNKNDKIHFRKSVMNGIPKSQPAYAITGNRVCCILCGSLCKDFNGFKIHLFHCKFHK